MKSGTQTIVEKLTSNIASPVSFGGNLSGDLFLISYSDSIVYKLVVDCASLVNLSGRNAANYIIQTAQTLNSSRTISNPLEVGYWSASQILLEPGFRTERGTIFKTEIGNCNL